MHEKPPKLYDCPCGKQHLARRTMKKHEKTLREGGKIIDGRVHIKQEFSQFAGEKSGEKDKEQIIRRINLEGEFEKMEEIVNPKKEAPKIGEYKYKCGACETRFNEKSKYCPGCGKEFE